MKNELYPNLTKRGIENFWKLSFLEKFIQLTNGFIAGGCFKNILSDEPIKDIDVYFRTPQDFDEAVKTCNKQVEDGLLKLSYENERVIAFVDLQSDIRIELIYTIYGSPEDVISQFDFTITKFVLYSEDQELEIIHHNDFFEHLSMKRLVIDDLLLFPVSTFERSYKYRDYGYKLCKESRMKLVKSLNSLPVVNEADFIQSFYAGLD